MTRQHGTTTVRLYIEIFSYLCTMETWKDIKGFEGLYQISNSGTVKSLPKTWVSGFGRVQTKQETIMKPSLTKGYKHLLLYKEGKYYARYVHRLVAEAFVPNPLGLPQVNHKDGDKSNNNDWNLEWVTQSENTIHAYKTGLNHKGLHHPNSKQVLNVETGVFYYTVHEAARSINMNHQTLRAMLNGRNRNRTTLRYV